MAVSAERNGSGENPGSEPRFEKVLERLGRSGFRSGIRLGFAEVEYLERKGLETVLSHGRDFVRERLAPARPGNDGKQTPWRGHPVFTAQHATATCCRKCLSKWHGIPKGRKLSESEVDYVLDLIGRWLLERSGNRHT